MQLDDTATLLAQAEFFEVCDAEQRRFLAFSSELMQFRPGEALYQSGEVPAGAHVLVSGTLSAEENGSLHAISQAGAVIGAMALVIAKARPLTITATSDVETLFVPRSAFMKLARQYPDLAARAAQRISRDLGAYLGAIEPAHRRMRKDVV